jgi:hypothetical protein
VSEFEIAIARTGYVVVFLRILFCVCDEKTAFVLDATGRSLPEYLDHEIAAGVCRNISAIAARIGGAEYVDGPGVAVGGKRKAPRRISANTRPLQTAPLAELSKATTARVGSRIVPAQAEIVPSSVSKIEAAGMFVPGTRNPVVGLVVGFQTMPVGAAGVGGADWSGRKRVGKR